MYPRVYPGLAQTMSNKYVSLTPEMIYLNGILSDVKIFSVVFF